MEGLTEGRIVHYVLPDYEHCLSAGEHRSAIIVRVWPEDEEMRHAQENGVSNLQVFTDYSNDFEAGHPAADGQMWATSVPYDEDKLPHTWHWIEKA